jgi:hypothetical protein
MAKQYMFDFSHFFCNHPVDYESKYRLHHAINMTDSIDFNDNAECEYMRPKCSNNFNGKNPHTETQA